MKKTLLTLFLATIVFGAFAQSSYIKNRWNIKAAYCVNSPFKKKLPNTEYGFMQVEADYGVLKYVELGGYLAYDRIKSYIVLPSQTPGSYTQIHNFANGIGYGVVANVHALPFLIKADDCRFDIYFSAKYGGFYYATRENYYPTRGFWQSTGAFGGISFYLTKHIGIYSEYGRIYYLRPDTKGAHIKYGLNLKF